MVTGRLKGIEGKYELLEKLSEGGMGAVYKVRHRLLDRIRVIKVMRPQLATDEEMKARFVREAQLAARLSHPSIAEVYDFAVEDDGSAYLVLEYIRGLTLEEIGHRLRDLDLSFVLDVAHQCLDALGYLHAKGIIHRDLSPDNVMLTASEAGGTVAKLIDLGIAKLVDSDHGLTQAGAFIGKVKYASPELFRTKEGIAVDARADLYSFGLVLYELLTGVHPFGKADVSGYITSHLFHPPQDFDESDAEGRVPDDLRAIVLRALAKNRDDRYATAADFSIALGSVRERLGAPADELGRAVANGGLPGGEPVAATPGATQAELDRRFAPVVTAGDGDFERDRTLAPTLALGMATEPIGGAMEEVPDESPVPLSRDFAPSPRRARTPKWRLLAAAAVVSVGAIGAAVLWWPREPEPPGPVPAATAGRLALDARPWAEVASVIDADGRPVAIGGRLFTPVTLDLPVGTYRVVLTQEGEQRDLTVEVTGTGIDRRTADFGRGSADELLTSLGVGQK